MMKNKNMKVIPISLKQANDFVEKYHRHHNPVVGHKFSIGALYDNEKLVGVAICGRPVSRRLDNGKILEVTRLCTDGTYNACSFLYSRCAKIAKDMGYEKIITYILESENGASLRASGWTLEQENAGGISWNVPSRPRELEPTQLSLFPQKRKYPAEKKKRYCKILNGGGSK